MVQLGEGTYDMMSTVPPPFPTKIMFDLEHKVVKVSQNLFDGVGCS